MIIGQERPTREDSKTAGKVKTQHLLMFYSHFKHQLETQEELSGVARVAQPLSKACHLPWSLKLWSTDGQLGGNATVSSLSKGKSGADEKLGLCSEQSGYGI